MSTFISKTIMSLRSLLKVGKYTFQTLKIIWNGDYSFRHELNREVTPTVTRDLGFPGLIWRTAPISRLLRHTWGCGGSILYVQYGNFCIECAYQTTTLLHVVNSLMNSEFPRFFLELRHSVVFHFTSAQNVPSGCYVRPCDVIDHLAQEIFLLRNGQLYEKETN
jgi:hypothetical protein